MLKSVNSSTVAIRENGISALNALCKHHKITKVNLLTYVVNWLITLDDSEIDAIISEGKIVELIVELGGKVDYPDGIVTKYGVIKQLIREDR